MAGLNLQEKGLLERILKNLGTSYNQVEEILEDIAKQHGVTYAINFDEGAPEDFPHIQIYLISENINYAKTMRDVADEKLRLTIPSKAYDRLFIMYADPF